MLRYKNFTLIKPTEEQSKIILDLIDTSNGSVFHELELNKIISDEFNSDLYYFVDNSRNITNFAPVHIIKPKFLQKRYELKPLYDIPYAGFLNDDRIDFNQLKCGLFESIVYAGMPVFNSSSNNQTIIREGETCVIDLNLSEDEIFNQIIHSKRRNMIRKADKSGIVVKTYFSSEGIDKFWPVLFELHKKLEYTHLNKSLYEKLITIYGAKKQAYIIVAFKNNMPISGAFFIGNKNYMLYYKGASSFGVKNEGQGERIQWEAIKVAKSLNIKYYDLGNLQKDLLSSIYKFKTGISNRILKYPIYYKHGFGFKLINKIG